MDTVLGPGAATFHGHSSSSSYLAQREPSQLWALALRAASQTRLGPQLLTSSEERRGEARWGRRLCHLCHPSRGPEPLQVVGSTAGQSSGAARCPARMFPPQLCLPSWAGGAVGVWWSGGAAFRLLGLLSLHSSLCACPAPLPLGSCWLLPVLLGWSQQSLTALQSVCNLKGGKH